MEQMIRIEGMSCGGCVASVERAVRGVAGVHAVRVDLSSASAMVEFDPAQTDLTRIKAAIEEAGFDVVA